MQGFGCKNGGFRAEGKFASEAFEEPCGSLRSHPRLFFTTVSWCRVFRGLCGKTVLGSPTTMVAVAVAVVGGEQWKRHRKVSS